MKVTLCWDDGWWSAKLTGGGPVIVASSKTLEDLPASMRRVARIKMLSPGTADSYGRRVAEAIAAREQGA